jgi:lysyl-tRNA synthetase class 1
MSYSQLKAWPFVQANAILEKINYKTPEKGYVLLETGYGPSGLPHIGTFGEVVRTIMIQKALHLIAPDIPTRLICFSDDMDGLRKVPENIPNQSEYKQYIGRPLTNIPDPFGTHKSYADNMNSRLCNFLDSFGLKYEFISSTHCYRTGVFNEMLLRVLEKYDEIMALMLPTLGEERQATYSPFLPVCKRTGVVLQVPIIDRNLTAGTITYIDPETHESITLPVTDGHCKLQWKPDFGMRWAVLDVDFEMFGKDVGMNAELYTKICKILVNKAPIQMIYEMFLDEQGKKISKSKGTGVTINDWLKYAPAESLKLFMFISPQKAKKLSFDIIPRYVDDLMAYCRQYISAENDEKKLENPVHHIIDDISEIEVIASAEISYSLILNLVSACNSTDPEMIWNYIDKFTAGNLRQSHFFKRVIEGVINYYKDFVSHQLRYIQPNQEQEKLIRELNNFLKNCADDVTADVIQNELYRIARENGLEMKDWFKLLYQVLIGSESGPRFGSFITLYGIHNTIKLIDSKIPHIY